MDAVNLFDVADSPQKDIEKRIYTFDTAKKIIQQQFHQRGEGQGNVCVIRSVKRERIKGRKPRYAKIIKDFGSGVIMFRLLKRLGSHDSLYGEAHAVCMPVGYSKKYDVFGCVNEAIYLSVKIVPLTKDETN